MRRPFIKFYFSDWQNEAGLKLCGRATRSFFLDLMGIMHEADPYGHLLINGEKPSPATIAKITGDTPREVNLFMAELILRNVVSTGSGNGVIFSRKMVRDEEKRLKNKGNGSLGGNPRLNPTVNHRLKGRLKAHIPEAREESKNDPSDQFLLSSAGLAASPAEGPAADPPDDRMPIEKVDPRWSLVRASLGKADPAGGDQRFKLWFADCVLSDAPEATAENPRPSGTLWAPSRFASDKIELQFERTIDHVFGAGVVKISGFRRPVGGKKDE